MSLDVENRVSTLEQVLQRFIEETEKSISTLVEERRKDRHEREKDRQEMRQDREERNAEMDKFQMEMQKDREERISKMDKFQMEMQEDREERISKMDKFQLEMQEDREERISKMDKFQLEMQKDREESKKYRKKMRKDTEDMKKDTKNMKKQWGELANKMGTLIEDIIMPGMPSTLKKYFGAQLNFSGTHIKKYLKELDLKGEFDIVATDEDRVYVADVKSSPDKKKIDDFKKKVIPRFRKLFPEYDSKTLIPIMGSVRFDDDIISYASKEGIYVMGYREWEYLDILNFDEVKSK